MATLFLKSGDPQTGLRLQVWEPLLSYANKCVLSVLFFHFRKSFWSKKKPKIWKSLKNQSERLTRSNYFCRYCKKMYFNIQAALVIRGLFICEIRFSTFENWSKNDNFLVKNGLFICKFKIRGPKWQNASTANNKGNLYTNSFFRMQTIVLCLFKTVQNVKSPEEDTVQGWNMLWNKSRNFKIKSALFIGGYFCNIFNKWRWKVKYQNKTFLT